MKKEKIKAPKRYCNTCGTLMEATLHTELSSYDNYTGKFDAVWNYQCPNNKGKHFWQKHDEWPTYPDF